MIRLIKSTPPRAKIGLGDVVSKIVAPIATASDAVLGTNLKNCVSCGVRKVALNEIVPDVLNPFAKQ